MTIHPLWQPFLEKQAAVILDGGLATELEAWGYDLRDPLWSARLLLEEPEAIRQVHLAYLRAGADCIITASYQATIIGFQQRGLSEAEAQNLILKAVELAVSARDEFWSNPQNQVGRQWPLVAASVGPYGAYLANGAEYTGDYDLDMAGLVAFHRPRWQLLAHSPADLLACETIPSFIEAQALAHLLQETPGRVAWFCFSGRDEHHISDGTPLATCAQWLEPVEQLIAIGLNCTAPHLIPSLIQQLQPATSKPIVVYPNSGERYDPVQKCWSGDNIPEEFGTGAREWRKLGAALIGGCCRTRPGHIVALRSRLGQKLA